MDDIVKTMQGKLSYGSKQGGGGGVPQLNNHKIFSESFLNILQLGSYNWKLHFQICCAQNTITLYEYDN